MLFFCLKRHGARRVVHWPSMVVDESRAIYRVNSAWRLIRPCQMTLVATLLPSFPRTRALPKPRSLLSSTRESMSIQRLEKRQGNFLFHFCCFFTCQIFLKHWIMTSHCHCAVKWAWQLFNPTLWAKLKACIEYMPQALAYSDASSGLSIRVVKNVTLRLQGHEFESQIL